MSPRRRLPGGLPGLLLRVAPARAMALAILVAVASGSVTLVPAWYASRTAAGLPAMLEGAGQGRLGLEFGQGGRVETGVADPMSGVAAAGEAVRATLPATVAGIVGRPTDLVDTPEYNALDAPVPITRTTLRFQPDAAAMTRYVDGRPPSGTVTERQIGSLHDQDGNPMLGRSFEAAVSRETADELGLHVGDHLSLMPGTNITGVGLGITITGIFEALDRTDTRWFDDVTLLSPVEVRASAEVTIYHMVALLSDDVYPVFAPGPGAGNGGPSTTGGLQFGGVGSPILRYRWRFPVDASGSTAWNAAALSDDLARLAVAYPYRGALGADAPGLSTGLGNLLDAYLAQRSIATTSFALAAAGPLAAGIGILAVAAAALAERRRVTLGLLRSRGVGPGRLFGAETVAAAVLAVPAAAAGSILALGVIAAGSRLESVPGLALAAAVGTALLALALLLVAALGALRAPAGSRTTRRSRRLLSPGRSRVLTGLVVVVATGAAIALQTTARPVGTTGPDGGAVLVPVLLGVAGGIVITRAFGLATRGIARVAARSRGFAVVHALRGLARDAGARDLPFVVLTVAVTAGIFASVVSGSLARSQGVAAANTVGADWQIAATTAAGLPSGLDTTGLAAIGPTAVVGQTGGSLSSRTLASTFVSVSVVDADAYGRVTQGTLVDAGMADALTTAGAGPGPGTGASVPLILRSSFASRAGLAPGAAITFTAAGQPMNAVVGWVLADLPGLPPGSDVVVAAGTMDDAAVASVVPVTVLLRAGPDPAPVERVIAPYRAQMTLQSRDALLRTLSDTPMANAMRDGFTVMLVLSSVLAGAVVAASLLAALGGRAREAALLRTLGVDERAARRIVVGEAAMTIAVALGTGLVLGLGIASLTVPSLGIEQLAGVVGPVVPVADPAGVLAAVAGPVVVGLIALAAGFAVVRGSRAPVRLLAEEA